ncbi:MAG: LysM peptidoglycan-binding domain-containing protein [Lachnotalea sp.]
MNRSARQISKQQYYIVVMTLCLTIAVIVTCGSFISIAKNNTQDSVTYKYYTSIQIHSGDTLWDLSKDYISTEYNSIYDYINEVKRLNSLQSDNIKEGQYLTVPYYSCKALD